MSIHSKPATEISSENNNSPTQVISPEALFSGMLGEAHSYPIIVGYEIIGRLGRGGMGSVYKARDLNLKRLVALKLLELGGENFQDRLERFRIEAEAIAKLRHPNIIQIYDVGNHEGRPFICLELAEGGSLAARIRAQTVSHREAVSLVRELALAIHFAHSNGVIHRDLKPHNVLLTTDGVPKLTDFGIAKLVDEARTRTGDIMGTPAYMAPEQARGRSHEVGPATDVYGLGTILYELVAGHPPFEGNSLDVLRRVCDEEPAPLSRLSHATARVPRDLAVIVSKCLEKSPARRYACAADLADDLQRFLDGRSISARPVGPFERLFREMVRNPVVSSLLALLVGGFLAAFLLVVWLWLDANTARREAEHQGSIARDKANAAEASQREVARREAEALLHLGILECQKGTVEDGFERLIEALNSAEVYENFDLARLIRINLASFGAIRMTSIPLDGHKDWAWEITSSPDGQLVATASRDGTAKIWERHTGKLLTNLDHQAPIKAIAFSPDSRWFVTGGEAPEIMSKEGKRGQLRFWSLPNFEQVGETVYLPVQVTGFRLAPDHESFLYMTPAFVQVCRYPNEQRAFRPINLPLELKSGMILNSAFHPDGSAVLIGGVEMEFDKQNNQHFPIGGVARLIDLKTGKAIGPPYRHTREIIAVAFQPNGELFATGGFDGKAYLWDAHTGRRVAELPVPEIDYPDPQAQIREIAFSPDGQMIAIAGGLFTVNDQGEGKLLGGAVRFWSVPLKLTLGVTLEHPAPVWSLAFSPDGQRLLTGCEDRKARLWSVSGGGQIGEDMWCGGMVHNVGFTPDGNAALTSASAGNVPAQIWNLMTTSPVRSLLLPADTDWVMPSPDGSFVGVVHGGRARLLSLPDGREITELVGDVPFEHMIRSISPDGKYVAVQVQSDRVQVWNAQTDVPIGPSFPIAYPHWVWFRADGAVMVPGVNQIQFWDPRSGKHLGTKDWTIWFGAVSEDGMFGLTCDADPPGFYRLNPPRKEHEFRIRDRLSTVALSPDGEVAALGHFTGILQTVATRDGSPIGKVMPHPKEIEQIIFNRDGSLLLSATSDGEVYLWDVASGEQLGPPVRHAAPLWRIGFLPPRSGNDGPREYFYSIDKRGEKTEPVIRFWPVPEPIAGSPEELRSNLGLDPITAPPKH